MKLMPFDLMVWIVERPLWDPPPCPICGTSLRFGTPSDRLGRAVISCPDDDCRSCFAVISDPDRAAMFRIPSLAELRDGLKRCEVGEGKGPLGHRSNAPS